MIQYWDYLMRRKTLLLPVTMLFLLSSLLSYGLLRRYQVHLPVPELPATYIHVELSDHDDEDPTDALLYQEIEVPHTGNLEPLPAEAASPAIISTIMDPAEVIDLSASDTTETPETTDAPETPDPTQENPKISKANPATEPASHLTSILILLVSLSLVGGFWAYFTYEHYTR